MGKVFQQVAYDPKKVRSQIDQFGRLLRSKAALSERNDVQPFFKRRPHLAAFIGSYMKGTGPATDFAFEYPFYGDFAADLVVGDRADRRFCVVEFEDGRKDSIFRTPRGKATTEWSPRFEHGFSQIVDWFTLISDVSKTARFQKDFGHQHVRFSALLVIGREAGLTAHDRYRLEWRAEKVRVDSHAVECVTFDALHASMDRLLRLNTGC